MRIACVGYLHGAGGAERQIVMLANEMAARGHMVSLIVLVDFKSKYEILPTVNVIDLTAGEKNAKNKVWYRYKELRKTYETICPEITIHYWMQSAYLTAMMPKKIGGRTIYSERANPGESVYGGLLKLVRKLAFARMDGFVFQSEGAQNYFSDKIKARSVVIQNSVSVPPGKYRVPKVREKRIVTVGRLHEQKNQKLLIQAFAKISNDFREYTLEIYGDGDLKQELQLLIHKLNLEERVFLKGSRKNIFECIVNASLFVLCSDYEGMPNTLMEAMALGLPCITTDCRPGGARALVCNGQNGIIVPVGDVGTLAEQMNYVLAHGEEREKFSMNAIKILETNAPEMIFSNWEKFITSVLMKRK